MEWQGFNLEPSLMSPAQEGGPGCMPTLPCRSAHRVEK